jgi:PAS domain-containing protein
LKTRAADARDVPAKLRSGLDDALSTCEALLLHLGEAEHEVERLKQRASTRAAEYEHLFHEMPLACVVIDPTGRIVNANAQAAVLLNVSARRLPDRLLMHFIDDRETFQALLTGLSPHVPMRATLTVRPRERARIDVVAYVLPVERPEGPVGLCFLSPRPQESERPRGGTRRPIPVEMLPPSVSQGA